MLITIVSAGVATGWTLAMFRRLVIHHVTIATAVVITLLLAGTEVAYSPIPQKFHTRVIRAKAMVRRRIGTLCTVLRRYGALLEGDVSFWVYIVFQAFCSAVLVYVLTLKGFSFVQVNGL